MFIALMVDLNLLSKEEGAALAKKISTSTLPGDFESATTQLKKFRATIAKDL